MEFSKRKSVMADLNKFDSLAKDYQYIEVTEWSNGEGYDINFEDRSYRLTHGELDAINFLIKSLDYNND